MVNLLNILRCLSVFNQSVFLSSVLLIMCCDERAGYAQPVNTSSFLPPLHRFTQIQAKHVIWNGKTQELILKGNVVISQKPWRIKCEKLVASLTSEGQFKYIQASTQISIQGKDIYAQAHRLNLDIKKEYLELTHGVLVFWKKQKIEATSFMLWSKEQRVQITSLKASVQLPSFSSSIPFPSFDQTPPASLPLPKE